MAQLKDSIVSGNLRVTDTTLTDTIQVTKIKAPTTSGGTTYGPGTSGQVLKSNGTSVYWTSDSTVSPATANPQNISTTAAVGTSTLYARQDHVHAIALATGDANGQVKIAGSNVSVKGLGSAAYTASTDYAVSKTLTNQDLNTVTDPGFYNAAGANTCTNKPTGIDAFGLEVIHSASGSYYTQILYPYTSATPYRRICNNGTWGSWTLDKIVDESVKQLVASSNNTAYRPIIVGMDYGDPGYTATEKTDSVYAVSRAMIKPSTGDVILYSPTGDSPALTFQRGTTTDDTLDWKIFNTGGKLNFNRSKTDGTWENILDLDPTNNVMRFKETAVSLNGHTHSYLPLSGGTITGDIEYVGGGNRKLIFSAGSFKYYAASTSAWAGGLQYYNNTGTTGYGGFGAYGAANSISYFYMGGTYDTPYLKLIYSSGNIEMKSGATLTFGKFSDASDDLARHVFFRHSSSNQIVVDDDFKYNPSTNVLTVGSISGSAAKLTTGRTIALGTGVTSTATTFDGSANITIPVTGIKEAYLTWGGKDFSGSYGPMDAALQPRLGANRMEFLKAAGITIERTTDGGTTWTTASTSDTAKTGLFTVPGYTTKVSTTSTAGTGTAAANNMLRVTVATGAASLYTILSKFIMSISTNGCSGCYVKIRIRLESDRSAGNDTWKIWNKSSKTWVSTTDASATEANTRVDISGWSGFNVINVSGVTTYGNQSASQYGNVQFIFGCTSNSSTSAGMEIYSIQGYGGVGWTVPSKMAQTGHLYSYDASQNATFPAALIATTLYEGSTALTDKYVKKAGDSMSGALSITTAAFGPLTIERTGGTQAAAIYFKNTNGVLGAIGMSGTVDSGLYRWTANTNSSYRILDAGNYTSYTYGATTSRTANTVLAAPNGSNGAATFRALVADDLPSHSHSDYVLKAGDTMSGGLTISQSTGGTFLTATRSDTSVTVKFGVGSDGTKHGIYSTEQSKWLFYGDASDVRIKTTSISSSTPSNDTWNIPLFGAPLSDDDGTKPLITSTAFRYKDEVLAASAGTGHAIFILGNGSNTGASGNRQGSVRLYSESTSYVDLVPASTSSAKTITLPAITGKAGVVTGTITSGQIVITDGTAGGIKSSGYTIATSVPSNALFTDEKVKATTLATSTTANTYYPTLVTAAGTAGVGIFESAKFSHIPGTTNVVGVKELQLGNATPEGSAGNEEGKIRLYARSTGFHTIKCATDTGVGADVQHTLPGESGTILNTGTTDALATYSTGLSIGTVKVNGSTSTYYVPEMTAATNDTAGTAGIVPAPGAGKQGSFLRGNGTWATPTNTKNTAGATDISTKIYLIGATSQATNPQTYSDNEVYVTNGSMYAKNYNATYDYYAGNNYNIKLPASGTWERGIVYTNSNSYDIGFIGAYGTDGSLDRFDISDNVENTTTNPWIRIQQGTLRIYASSSINAHFALEDPHDQGARLSYNSSVSNEPFMRLFPGVAGTDTTGSGMWIGDDTGGMTVVGAGHSAKNLRDTVLTGSTNPWGGSSSTAWHHYDRRLVLSSDTAVYLVSGASGLTTSAHTDWTDVKTAMFDSSGNFRPSSNKKGSIGTSANMWNTIYGATIYENGTALSSKYAPKSGTPSYTSITSITTVTAMKKFTCTANTNTYKTFMVKFTYDASSVVQWFTVTGTASSYYPIFSSSGTVETVLTIQCPLATSATITFTFSSTAHSPEVTKVIGFNFG